MYGTLKKWHQEFGDSIEILLYPSDEFGNQELPSKQVAPFVESKGLPTNGGGCTLMEKTKVNGPDADPLWKRVKDQYPGDVGWNFDGIFLFDARGRPMGRYSAGELNAVGKRLVQLVNLAKQEL